MKIRNTDDIKFKLTLIRTTREEHAVIKMAAAQRGISMSMMIIEAIKEYLEKNS